MMSASEGGSGSWRSVRSKVGCLNSIPKIRSKCGPGGKFAGHHIWKLPLQSSPQGAMIKSDNWLIGFPSKLRQWPSNEWARGSGSAHIFRDVTSWRGPLCLALAGAAAVHNLPFCKFRLAVVKRRRRRRRRRRSRD